MTNPFIAKKFKAVPPPQRSGRTQKNSLITEVIQSLDVGEAVEIPVSPTWRNSKHATNHLSAITRRAHGTGTCATRASEDGTFITVYRTK